MIKLDERDVRLITRVEKANFTNYKIVLFDDNYYIDESNLLIALEDTQDSREFAENKISELCNELNNRPEDCNSLQLSTMKANKELIEENEMLKEKIERIQSTLAEDDYDKLAMEGIELDG